MMPNSISHCSYCGMIAFYLKAFFFPYGKYPSEAIVFKKIFNFGITISDFPLWNENEMNDSITCNVNAENELKLSNLF